MSSRAITEDVMPAPSLIRRVIGVVTAPKGRAADRLTEARTPSARSTTAPVSSAPFTADRANLADWADTDLQRPTDSVLDGVDLGWITTLASRQANAPIGLLSVMTPAGLLYVGLTGMPFTLAGATESARGGARALCAHIATTSTELNVPHVNSRSLSPTQSQLLQSLGVAAYYGIPFRSESGSIRGALCVADTSEHEWDLSEIAVLKELANTITVYLQSFIEESNRSSMNISLPVAAASQVRVPLRSIQATLDEALAVDDAGPDTRRDTQREALLHARRNCELLSDNLDVLIRLTRRMS